MVKVQRRLFIIMTELTILKQNILAVSVSIPIKIQIKKSVNMVSGKLSKITLKQDIVKFANMKKPGLLSTNMIGVTGHLKMTRTMNELVLFVEKQRLSLITTKRVRP